MLLDACLSRDLLLTIFRTGSALHDGAVIVQGQRIAAAACFLPLTVRPGVARSLGTRHRAGIGVTEETDCLSLVVSEETGRISVAAFGEIEMDVTPGTAGRADHRAHHPQDGPRPRSASRLAEREDDVSLERESARDATAD